MGLGRISRSEAADLGFGMLSRGRISDIVRKGTVGHRAAPQLWAPAALCLVVIAFEQVRPMAVRAPLLRGVIETEITLCALAAASLFALSFGHRRHLRNLLLAGALLELAVIEFVSYLIPAAIDLRSPSFLAGASIFGALFMASAVVVAGSVGADRQVSGGRKPVLITIAACLLAAGIAEVFGLTFRAQITSSGGATHTGLAAALDHPVGLALGLTAAGLLVKAALRTSDRDVRGLPLLLAAAMVVLAGARVIYIVLPTPGVDWVTVREILRVTAYALILAAAVHQEAGIRRTVATAAAAEERRRIARDLHDGLAQDLAFIAAHGNRIARESGEDHPLAIAARRALAVSRGAIADLSAAEAPSAAAALRQVADELEVRFGVQVTVEADEAELPPAARDDVVRIVREAIVNAAKAHARNVTVSLERNGDQSVLRILDDGVGIGADGINSRPGFGLRSMRERARSLGGGLTARSSHDGGTELKVVFP